MGFQIMYTINGYQTHPYGLDHTVYFKRTYPLPFDSRSSLNSFFNARSFDDFFKQQTPDNSNPASSSIENRFKHILPPFKSIFSASSDGSISRTRFCIFFGMITLFMKIMWLYLIKVNIVQKRFPSTILHHLTS